MHFHTVHSCCFWSLILARALERRSRFGSIGFFHPVFALRCILSDVGHGWVILVSSDPRPPTRFGSYFSHCFCVAAGYGKSNHQFDVGQRHDCLGSNVKHLVKHGHVDWCVGNDFCQWLELVVRRMGCEKMFQMCVNKVLV